MHHLVGTKTVVGAGSSAVVLELVGASVRIKRRGQPDLLLPLEAAAAVGAFLLGVARPAAAARESARS